jgi:hypothetical protein
MHGASNICFPLLPAATVMGMPASKADLTMSFNSFEGSTHNEVLMTEPRHPAG